MRAGGLALIVALALALPGCGQPAALPTGMPAAAPARAPTGAAISPTTAPLSVTATTTATQASITTPTASFAVCSPLEGIATGELSQPDLLKNTFQPPRPGMDDGHHGIDLSYWSRGERKTMLGLPVHAALSGQVAAVIKNRQPYGNAVIIETRLEDIPAGWLSAVAVPAPEPTVQPAPNLVCPADPTDYSRQTGRSLYLLYAHLNKTPDLALGQLVTCGSTIGEVGTTGKSVNPHLHLETRVGPAGTRFLSMAHYDTSATGAEMSAYCTWRVSGLFQMFDPLKLFQPAGASLQP